MNSSFPTIFFGHGSPMNAIQETEESRTWKELGKSLFPAQEDYPEAIVMVSAHWLTKGTCITSHSFPETIHDFGGFPKELFQVQYPAPGHPLLAQEIADEFSFTKIKPTQDWGLDHGTWSVLKWFLPQANIPVLQLSIDVTKPFLWHWEMGQELAVLKNKRILFAGSGNLVHNLALFHWNNPDTPLPWAMEADTLFQGLIQKRDGNELSRAHALGKSAELAINSAEHYLPALYVLGYGAREPKLQFFNQKVQSAISMTGFLLGSESQRDS